MKNYEIYNANEALGGLVNEPLKGGLKFKAFRIKSELEVAVRIIIETLEGVEDEEERTEILEQKQDINISKFTQEELDPIPLTILQIANLKPLIEFTEEVKKWH